MNHFVIFALYTIFSISPDSIIFGVYLNPYQASKKSFLEDIFIAAESGYINTVVVDLKSDYGYLCYETEIPLAKELKAYKRYIDLEYLIKRCEELHIKLIGRIVCFRDNYLANYEDCAIRDSAGKIWYDKTGTAWVNPYNKKTHQYLISIIKELEKKGIKSVALDYVRFPTDGDIGRIRLNNVKGERYTPIIEFLQNLKDTTDIEIGVCIFGYAVWYDLKTEGQEVSRFAKVVDVIYPMLYPSHFHPSFKKEISEYWRNYWIYFDSVEESFKKSPLSVKIIPFVQGFDLYCERFDEDYIFSQIFGAFNADADGVLIWHAASNYTTSLPCLTRANNLIRSRYAQNILSIRRRVLLHQYQEIMPSLSLSLRKSQKKIQTSPNPDNRSDNPPSKRIQIKMIPDQISPW